MRQIALLELFAVPDVCGAGILVELVDVYLATPDACQIMIARNPLGAELLHRRHALVGPRTVPDRVTQIPDRVECAGCFLEYCIKRNDVGMYI